MNIGQVPNFCLFSERVAQHSYQISAKIHLRMETVSKG